MIRKFKLWLKQTIESVFREQINAFVAKASTAVDSNLKALDLAAHLRLEEMVADFQKATQAHAEAATKNIQNATVEYLAQTRSDVVEAVLATLKSYRVICPQCDRLVHSFTRTPGGVICTDCTAEASSCWQASPDELAADHALKTKK